MVKTQNIGSFMTANISDFKMKNIFEFELNLFASNRDNIVSVSGTLEIETSIGKNNRTETKQSLNATWNSLKNGKKTQIESVIVQ